MQTISRCLQFIFGCFLFGRPIIASPGEIAKTVGGNIDIIVGGHSHSLLWNGKAPTKEHVSGPYPIVITPDTDPDHKVLVVTAASFSKYLGNMTVVFDRKGDLVDFSSTPVFLNRSIPEDPEIKALLKPYTEKLHSLVREVVGYTNEDLLDSKCSSQECAIGNLVADAFLDAVLMRLFKDLQSAEPHKVLRLIKNNNVQDIFPECLDSTSYLADYACTITVAKQKRYFIYVEIPEEKRE